MSPPISCTAMTDPRAPRMRWTRKAISFWVTTRLTAWTADIGDASRERTFTERSPEYTIRFQEPADRDTPANQTVRRTGASRFAQRQIEHQRRLAPVADLCVKQGVHRM